MEFRIRLQKLSSWQHYEQNKRIDCISHPLMHHELQVLKKNAVRSYVVVCPVQTLSVAGVCKMFI